MLERSKSDDSILAYVNTNLRGNEAPYVACVNDVAEYDAD